MPQVLQCCLAKPGMRITAAEAAPAAASAAAVARASPLMLLPLPPPLPLHLLLRLLLQPLSSTAAVGPPGLAVLDGCGWVIAGPCTPAPTASQRPRLMLKLLLLLLPCNGCVRLLLRETRHRPSPPACCRRRCCCVGREGCGTRHRPGSPALLETRYRPSSRRTRHTPGSAAVGHGGRPGTDPANQHAAAASAVTRAGGAGPSPETQLSSVPLPPLLQRGQGAMRDQTQVQLTSVHGAVPPQPPLFPCATHTLTARP